MRKIWFLLPLILALVSGLLFFSFLSTGSLWDNDESTYAQIAREMSLRGDWLTLYDNKTPWFIHPPLYMWVTAILAGISGWSEATIRFLPALFGVGGVMLVFWTGKLLFDESVGFLGGIILLTSLQYLVQSRIGNMDTMLNFFLSAAMLSFLLAYARKEPKWYYLFFSCCGLAVLTKGAFGLLYPFCIILPFLLLERKGSALREIPWVPGVMILLGVSLPWYVVQVLRHGVQFLYQHFYLYTFQRMTTPLFNQHGPWYYYIPILLFGLLPWTGFLPLGIVRAWRERGRWEVLFLLLWSGLTFLFFSAVKTKLPNYIFFLYPPAALLLAREIGKMSWKETAGSTGVLLVVAAFLGIGLQVFARERLLDSEFSGILSTIFFIPAFLGAGALLAVGFVVLQRSKGYAVRGGVLCLAVTMAALWTFLSLFVAPVLESYKPMKPLARKLVLRQRTFPAEEIFAFRVAGMRSLLFYSGLQITGVEKLEDLQQAWQSRRRIYCILANKDLALLRRYIPEPSVLEGERNLFLVSNFPAGQKKDLNVQLHQ